MPPQPSVLSRAPTASATSAATKPARRPLRGVRVLSLALNLPGPGALRRLADLGARCVKVEPPAPRDGVSADPMQHYSAHAYAQLHEGVRVLALNLKTEAGQRRLERELARADLLLTSFRPAALKRLGLDWRALRPRHPHLSLVAVVGAPGAAADLPGHDLTYQAEAVC